MIFKAGIVVRFMCRNKNNGFKIFFIMKSKSAALLKSFGVLISFLMDVSRSIYFKLVWNFVDNISEIDTQINFFKVNNLYQFKNIRLKHMGKHYKCPSSHIIINILLDISC